MINCLSLGNSANTTTINHSIYLNGRMLFKSIIVCFCLEWEKKKNNRSRTFAILVLYSSAIRNVFCFVEFNDYSRELFSTSNRSLLKRISLVGPIFICITNDIIGKILIKHDIEWEKIVLCFIRVVFTNRINHDVRRHSQLFCWSLMKQIRDILELFATQFQ